VAGGDLFAYHSPVAAVVVVSGQLVEAGGGERGGHVEDFDGGGGEVGGGQVAVGVAGGLGQGVAQAGCDAFEDVGRDGDGLGDGVGGLEADPPHVVGQAVGLGADDFDAAFAVLLEDAHRDGGGHADALQEDHHFFDDFLFFPGVGDHAGAFGAEAGDFGEAFGVVFDDVEGAGAEVVDDAFGHFGADAFDEAGAEVAADALDGGGQDGGVGPDLELAAVAGVGGPAAGEPERLAHLGAEQGADDGEEFGRAAGGHAGDGVAAVLVGVGDAFEDGFEVGSRDTGRTLTHR